MKNKNILFYISIVTGFLLTIFTLGLYGVKHGKVRFPIFKRQHINSTKFVKGEKKVEEDIIPESKVHQPHDMTHIILGAFGVMMLMGLMALLQMDGLLKGSIMTAEQQTKVVKEAEKFIGAPYTWGADIPCNPSGGCDCSSFTGTVLLNALDIELPRRAADQATIGRIINDLNEIGIGDLVFFDTGGAAGTTPQSISHVGLVSGVFPDYVEMINAESYAISPDNPGVKKAKIKKNGSGYWAKAFLKATEITKITKSMVTPSVVKEEVAVGVSNPPPSEPTKEQLIKLEKNDKPIEENDKVNDSQKKNFNFPFSDVNQNDKELINALNWGIQKGILSIKNDTFRPNGLLTRAELAKIIVESNKDLSKKQKDQKFSDIGGHWVNDYVSRLVGNNIMKGYPDGTFRPNDLVTRAEALKMGTEGAFKRKKPGIATDVSADSWINNYLGTAKEYFPNYNGGAFHPNDLTSRADAIQLLERLQ